jgi:hypothetical protein
MISIPPFFHLLGSCGHMVHKYNTIILNIYLSLLIVYVCNKTLLCCKVYQFL